MFSMQYRVLFGRDFDMGQIEARIAARAAPYDDLDGPTTIEADQPEQTLDNAEALLASV